MKVKFKFGRKTPRRAPVGAGLAIGVGGLLVAWGYRRWARKARAGRKEAGEEGSLGEGETHDPGVARLSERFGSLDEERATGHIPKALERDPKNIESSIHPG